MREGFSYDGGKAEAFVPVRVTPCYVIIYTNHGNQPLQTTKNIPLDYIDRLKSKRHILLLYENIEQARLVMFRFIKNGLLKGEGCIYATNEDSGEIILKMISYGIPLKFFETRQLRVFTISDVSGTKEEILEKSRKELAMMLLKVKSPFRIVTRIVPHVDNVAGITAELDLERQAHGEFDSIGGSIICPYDISRIEEGKKARWLEDLRENHHDIIYIPKTGYGGAFCQGNKP